MKRVEPFVLAVTGSIGSGKSTVVRMLSRLGAEVVDADEISRREARPDGRAYRRIVRAFGKPFLLGDGSLNRNLLAKKVFQDASLRRRLEGIIHPLVIREAREAIRASKAKVMVLDVPLLFESGMERLADKVCVVHTPQSVVLLRRRTARMRPPAYFRQRLRVQMPVREKLSRADFVIDNSGTRARTRAQVKQMWQMCARRK